MSYNYDYNPWEDNYTAANTAAPNNQQQSTGQEESYATVQGYVPQSGYVNPSALYQDPWSEQQYGNENYPGYTDGSSYAQQQQQTANEQVVDQQQQQQLQQQQQQQQPQQKQTSSMLGRFLRAHLPGCGFCMDTTGPLLDLMFKYVNRELLVSKIFYFFFYSAFGSLFPLMGVYFKQLGMNPAQVGIITGVRPFIEIFSAPFWNSLADKFQKGKILLLFSLASWIIFTYSLAHIRPPASACVAFNDTDYVLYTPYSDNDLSNYDVGQLDSEPTTESSQAPANAGEGNAAIRAEGGNEVFMSKMPDKALEEGKGAILAGEENANDQGRRRRKRSPRLAGREQIERPRLSLRSAQYNYAADASRTHSDTLEDDLHDSQLSLNVDLDNDFDDAPFARQLVHHENINDVDGDDNKPSFAAELVAGGVGRAAASGFEDGDGDRVEDDEGLNELDQQWHRVKRGLAMAWEAGDEDEEEESSGRDGPESADEQHEGSARRSKLGRTKGGQVVGLGADSREPADDSAEDGQERGRGEEGAIEDQAETGGEGESENEINYGDKKQRRHQQEHQLASNELAKHGNSMMTPLRARANGEDEEREEEEAEKVVDSKRQPNKTKRVYKQRHKTPPTHIVGMSPITVEYAINYNKEKHSQFVTPMFSTIVYKLDDIKEVFFLLLLLISLGEFFSAPALTIADALTLNFLGDNTDLYGRQRMFGSLGWAITLLLVGMALDNSTTIVDHPCGPHQRERSYTVCFTIFSLLMACAFLTATQFTFRYTAKSPTSSSGVVATKTTDGNEGEAVVSNTLDGHIYGNNGNTVEDLYASTRPREIFNTAPPVNAPPPGQQETKEKFEFIDKWKSAVFAQRTRELPQWVNVFRQHTNSMHLTYLFITWFLGCGVGLVFTFLFWHLQDVGGTPTLFGICSVINHVSEVLAYFFSSYFIKRFGHTKVLSVGLGCNVIRFIYVAFLSNPYYALPFELVQGITHAACFAACCSYMSHVSKSELKASTQGVMQGLHNGIGRACGALLGGYMINAIGSKASFCIYGLLSGCVLGGLLYIRKKASMEDDVRVDDNENLGDLGAPQGVPSAIPGKMV